MLNDIAENIETGSIYSFADDTRILKIIQSILDAKVLQTELNSTYDWADNNNLQFNEDKFELIKFGNDQTLKDL